jgi:RhtB (resistance to homoserine/threonine) family protein
MVPRFPAESSFALLSNTLRWGSLALSMLGTDHLLLFVTSGLVLNITPGQDTFYIVGRTVAHGRRAGVFAVMGVSAGCMVHTMAAAFGLSALLATSATAYQAFKLAGAAYLIYLGVRMVLERTITAEVPANIDTAKASTWSIFRGGLLSNVLNPKTALFFLSFLPQFVSPTTESRILTFLFLGTVFIFNGTLWCLFLVWTASTMRNRINFGRGAQLLVRRVAGALFVGLGIKLGLSR